MRSAVRIAIIVALLFLQLACDSTSTGPGAPQPGVTGRILDANGTPVAGARVYLLFRYSEVVPEPDFASLPAQSAVADTFSFALQPTLPHPASHSLYVRFTLPTAATATVSFHPRGEDRALFSRTESLLPGWYQQYYHRLIDTLQLSNGVYTVRLTTTWVSGGAPREAERGFLVIGDSGPPNAITSPDGSYFLDYRSIADGDSVEEMNDGYYLSTVHFGRTVNVLIVADGLREVYENIEFLPSMVVQRDMILKGTIP